MSHLESAKQLEIDRGHVAAVMADLRRAMQTRIDSGLVPVDGRWLTPSEAQKEVLDSHRRSRIHALELVLLFGANTIASLLIIALLGMLAY